MDGLWYGALLMLEGGDSYWLKVEDPVAFSFEIDVLKDRNINTLVSKIS